MSSTPADAGRRFRPRLWPSSVDAVRPCCLGRPGHLAAAAAGVEGRPDRGMRQAQLAEAGHADSARRRSTGLDFRRLSARGTYLHEAAFAFGLTAFDGQPGGQAGHPAAARGRRRDPRRPRLAAAGAAAAQHAAGPPAGRAGRAGRDRPLARRTSRGAGWRPTDTPAQRRWYNWDIPAHRARRWAWQLAPLELVLERSDGPAGLPRGRAGRDRFPEQSSELCAHLVRARRGAPGHLHPVQLQQAGS